MSPAASLIRYWPEPALLRRGLIYALSFLALAGVGWLTGDQGYLWSATASIWTCLADRQGTASARLSSLGAVGIGGALASALGTVVAPTPWLALPVVMAAGLAAGLAEIRGTATALAAKLLYVVLVAACLQPGAVGDLAPLALLSGLDYLRGGMFACLVCLALIPSERDERPRREVLAAYEALVRFAAVLADSAQGHDLAACKQDLRNRIEAAREAIEARRSLRDATQLLHHSYALGIADALFAMLIVAGELRDRAGPGGHGLPLRHIARSVADARDQVREALARHAPDLPALSAALRHDLHRLTAPGANAGAPPSYQSAVSALARYPAFEAWRAAFAWPRRGAGHGAARLLGSVADHLARDAVAARHALRLALAGSLCLMPAQLWQLDHGYWVAVTVIMVLSPRLQTTRQVSLKRFAGSLAGALCACVIGLFHPAPAIALGISAVFLAGAYANRLAGQPGAFAFCLTPAVILFSWMGAPMLDSSHFAALRGIDTAVGCLIALATYYVLAPRVEMSRVFRHAVDAVTVNAVYLRAALAAARVAEGKATPGAARLEALRIAAGRASSRAEHTLEQSAGALATAHGHSYRQAHATARRMAALAGVVRAGIESGAFALPASAGSRALMAWLEARLAELAIRPGSTGDAVAAGDASDGKRPEAPPGPEATPGAIDVFLAEQADYARAHIAAAHAAVAGLRVLGTTARKPVGRWRVRRS
ncbi:FUSC family protein [Cupriavidus sp. P-10]|uniref:FUSC family protein n=1 Tax=unclassified Cupriavidus TaxID=2640874 RepID=UPI000E2E5190|nr:FUSC family protein [Cupriavidus sp. P-10]BDB25801.1 FUSC family protein [Cupriavidus sp. P-10]